MISSPSSMIQYNNNICQFVLSIQQNDLKVLKKMMKTKLSKNLKLVRSGIRIAFQHNNCEALKILISSPLPNLFEDDLLHNVVHTSKKDFLRILLSDKRIDINQLIGDSDDMRTPLMVACTSGKVEMVEELLKYPKVDVNFQYKNNKRSALCYALLMGTSEMVQMLLNHRDTSESIIQESLLVGMISVSIGDLETVVIPTMELLEFLVKKNFKNGFNLKALTNGRHKFHEYFQGWISEEIEMKIREEYHNGNNDITEESVCNRAFGFSYYVLQASILKCECFHCNTVKTIKQEMYSNGVQDSEFRVQKFKENFCTADKCLLKDKLLFEKRTVDILSDFITSPLPFIFEHIVINGPGAHKNDLDRIFYGTTSLEDIELLEFAKGCYGSNDIPLEENLNGRCEENEYTINETQIKQKHKNLQIIDENTTNNNCKDYKKYEGNTDFDYNISENVNNNKQSSIITENISKVEEKKEDATENDEINLEVVDYTGICWSCSLTSVRLYKCSGCRKARYCSDQCIEEDWDQHGSYCIKIQKRRSKKKSSLSSSL